MKNRYEHLFEGIASTVDNSEKAKEYRIVEVGTYAGGHAEMMIRHAQNLGRKNISYVGFDLFEKLTPELSVKEKSKTAMPPPRRQVLEKLQRTGVDILLYGGFTNETIPSFLNAFQGHTADLIFIDGGHSLETIDSDWKNCQKMMGPKTVCLFDDYYPDRVDFGCKTLIDNLSRDEWQVELLEPVDYYDHTKTTVQFAKVKRASK